MLIATVIALCYRYHAFIINIYHFIYRFVLPLSQYCVFLIYILIYILFLGQLLELVPLKWGYDLTAL